MKCDMHQSLLEKKTQYSMSSLFNLCTLILNSDWLTTPTNCQPELRSHLKACDNV